MPPNVFDPRAMNWIGSAAATVAVVLVLVLVGVAVFYAGRQARRAALRRRSGRAPQAALPTRVELDAPEARPSDPPVSDPLRAFDLARALDVGVRALPGAHPAATRHPIVLVHGYFGFEALGVSKMKREYFRGVRAALEALGYEVHVARVAPAAAVSLRAAQLARQIQGIAAERVNVIAHSMGGLDARYAIARLGLADRVASLITVGTPHHGTPVADRSARFFGEWRRLRRALHALGANVDGLYDLTTARMEAFNHAVPDAEGVTYASVVGSVMAHRKDVHAFLAPGHAYLARLSGPNDGLVPAASQRWGRVLGVVDADHWAQIGWSQGFDAGKFYAAIAAHLVELGH
jgi:triacylglycerol lipase